MKLIGKKETRCSGFRIEGISIGTGSRETPKINIKH